MNDLQEYLEAGFKDVSFIPKDKRFCTHFLQKKVQNRTGTILYFINVWVYDFSEFGGPKCVSDADSHMYTKETGDFGIAITIKPRDVGGVQGVLRFFESAYVALGCIPDIHND